MTEQTKDAIAERAERGKEILESQKATGDPGTAQPKERQERDLKSVADDIEKIQEQTRAETREGSAKRAEAHSGNHEVPPAERSPAYAGDQITAQAAAAAGHLSAARTALDTQLTSDARLTSDPRYERDQKVFEMGRTGQLGAVPPSEAEQAALAARAGVPGEAIDKLPDTTEEQVADDLRRLEEGKQRAANQTGPVYDEEGKVKPGRQESDKNTSKGQQFEPPEDEGTTPKEGDADYGSTVIR
jgi:hypothetical protein